MLTHEELNDAISEYQSLLDDRVTETKVHQFLAHRSYFFNGALRLHGPSPLYSRVKLGNDHEVDFAWFDSGSNGAEWRLVEIEAPGHSMFTKSGEASHILNHAVQQVRDWHSWVHEHLGYARKIMPWIEYPLGYVIVGRRSELTITTAKRLRRLCFELRPYAEIHSLDWLADLARTVHGLIAADGGTWAVPPRAYSHRRLMRREPKDAFDWLFGPWQARAGSDRLLDRLKIRDYAHQQNDEINDVLEPNRLDGLKSIPFEGGEVEFSGTPAPEWVKARPPTKKRESTPPTVGSEE